MHVRCPGVSVVAHPGNHLPRLHGLALFDGDVADVGVHDGRRSVVKKDEARLGVSVHRSRHVRRIRLRNAHDGRLERGKDVALPGVPVLIFFTAGRRFVRPRDTVVVELFYPEVAGELIAEAEVHIVGMLSGRQKKTVLRRVNRRMNENRLRQRIGRRLKPVLLSVDRPGCECHDEQSNQNGRPNGTRWRDGTGGTGESIIDLAERT